MRRLLVAAVVALGAAGAFAPAQALTDPPCYTVPGEDLWFGYCAGIVCDDLCYWRSYPTCFDGAGDRPVDVCAVVNMLPTIE